MPASRFPVRPFQRLDVTHTPLPRDVTYATPNADTFAVDCAESSVRFTVRFLGFHTVGGGFTDFSGMIQQMPDPARSLVELRIQTASVMTRNSLRDRHLRSRHYFNSARFPSIEFRASRIVPVDASS